MPDDPFKPKESKIAIIVRDFTLLKTPWELFEGRYREPYISSIAVHANADDVPQVAFNLMPFPKVDIGEMVEMVGDGHLIYGPENPGAFVAISVLIMESDSDIRRTGAKIEKFIKSKGLELGLNLIIASNPGAAATLAVIKELTHFLAGMLKENQDDELFRVEGTFLRDGPVPYHINRRYRKRNQFAEVALEIIPLAKANGQGEKVKKIAIEK